MFIENKKENHVLFKSVEFWKESCRQKQLSPKGAHLIPIESRLDEVPCFLEDDLLAVIFRKHVVEHELLGPVVSVNLDGGIIDEANSPLAVLVQLVPLVETSCKRRIDRLLKSFVSNTHTTPRQTLDSRFHIRSTRHWCPLFRVLVLQYERISRQV